MSRLRQAHHKAAIHYARSELASAEAALLGVPREQLDRLADEGVGGRGLRHNIDDVDRDDVAPSDGHGALSAREREEHALEAALRQRPSAVAAELTRARLRALPGTSTTQRGVGPAAAPLHLTTAHANPRALPRAPAHVGAGAAAAQGPRGAAVSRTSRPRLLSAEALRLFGSDRDVGLATDGPPAAAPDPGSGAGAKAGAGPSASAGPGKGRYALTAPDPTLDDVLPRAHAKRRAPGLLVARPPLPHPPRAPVTEETVDVSRFMHGAGGAGAGSLQLPARYVRVGPDPVLRTLRSPRRARPAPVPAIEWESGVWVSAEPAVENGGVVVSAGDLHLDPAELASAGWEVIGPIAHV